MTTLRRHNPVLRSRLSALLASDDATTLSQALGRLSNADARTAGYLLAEELFPAMSDGERFMQFFLATVPLNAKAYLGTFLKGAVRLTRQQVLTLSERQWEEYAALAGPIDCRKLLEVLLPVATDADAVEHLMELFARGSTADRATLLIAAATPPCYYRLMCLLRTCEEDRALLTHVAILLIRLDRPIAFAMASILYHYFGLDSLPATFSLRLEPYELSRLDTSPETFYKTLLHK